MDRVLTITYSLTPPTFVSHIFQHQHQQTKRHHHQQEWGTLPPPPPPSINNAAAFAPATQDQQLLAAWRQQQQQQHHLQQQQQMRGGGTLGRVPNVASTPYPVYHTCERPQNMKKKVTIVEDNNTESSV
jgi:hypothetical protein